MTLENETESEERMNEREERELQAWLHGALEANPKESVDVLSGVQHKLRERSGGKFYADRWSTVRYPPVSTYLITSLAMLAFVALSYFVLHPLQGTPEPVRIEPPPVQVIMPRPQK